MWISVKDNPPMREIIVETKVDDDKGCRNFANLKLVGNLWFVPDGSTYVYYEPTHWRHLN